MLIGIKSGRRMVLALLAWLMMAGGVHGARVKCLTGEPTASPIVSKFWLSPDGLWLVYLEERGLYRIPVKGGTAIKLDLPSYRDGEWLSCSFLTITPDSRTVLFQVGHRDQPNMDLYRVPIGGGTPVRICSVLSDGASSNQITPFVLTPDGKTVVFLARGTDPNRHELYSVPLAGGTPVLLAGDVGADGGDGLRSCCQISPDSRWVYTLYQPAAGYKELHRIPIGGGTPATLASDPTTATSTIFFKLTPTGDYAVYAQSIRNSDRVNICSVPVVGGDPISLRNVESRMQQAFFLTNDGLNTIYLNVYDSLLHTGPHYMVYEYFYQFYRQPVTGGAAMRVNPALASHGDATDIRQSPSGRRIFVRAETSAPMKMDLYSVVTSSGAAIKLNAPIETGRQVDAYALSPDGLKVVYRVEWKTTSTATGDRMAAFYVVSAGGGPVRLIFQTTTPYCGLKNMIIDPSSSRMLCELTEKGGNDGLRSNLFSIPLTGGGGVRLNSDGQGLPSHLNQWQATGDGRHVVVLADLEYGKQFSPYMIPIAGGAPVNLIANVSAQAAIGSYFATPDRRRVVYCGNLDQSGATNLFSVPLSGGTSNRLNAPPSGSTRITDVKLTADCWKVIFQDNGSVFSALITGEALVKLDPPLATGQVFKSDSMALGPDGNSVYYPTYLQDLTNHNYLHDIYRLSSEGGAPLQHVSFTAEDTNNYKITTDGKWVVFGRQKDRTAEVYKIPMAGGEPVRLAYFYEHFDIPLQLTPAGDLIVVVISGQLSVVSLKGEIHHPISYLPSGISLAGFRISPDGKKLVYATSSINSLSGAHEYNLYSDSILGGIKQPLNSKVASGPFNNLAITPDGQHVTYYSSYEHQSILVVPIEGGAEIRHDGPNGSKIDSYEVTPDGTKVLCIAWDAQKKSYALYVSALTSAQWTRLGDVYVDYPEYFERNCRIFGDSSGVAFRSDADGDGNVELLVAPLDGRAPVKISGPAVRDTLQRDYWVSPDGATVLYCADPGTGIRHLYASFLVNGIDDWQWQQYR